MSNVFTAGRGLNALDLSRLGAAIDGTFVIPSTSGGAVTTSAGMTVAVSAITAATVTIGGTVVATGYAGGTVTLDAADATNPRIDSIYYDTAGGVDNATGTAIAVTSTTGPVPPTLSATQIRLADIYVAAGATSIASGDITDRRQAASANIITVSGLTQKYKSATQTFSATTTFADVAASSGNLAFSIAANEVWEVEWWIPATTFTGTGGLKLQVTGPAAPTAVTLSGFVIRTVQTDVSTPVGFITMPLQWGPTTSFSSSFVTGNASGTQAAGDNGKYYTGDGNQGVYIRGVIANGSNAGTVTLQGAQNSANGTTVIGVGAYMIAQRMA